MSTLQKMISARKAAFLSQDKEKYFFDLQFNFLDGRVVYAHKFFLLAISKRFESLINFGRPLDIKANQSYKNIKTMLVQCYTDSIVSDSDGSEAARFTQMVQKNASNYRKIAENRFALFLNQDEKNGLFDVAFQFKDQKILHCHKFMLAALSPVFQTMLENEEVIQIKLYTFEEFKEILTFFYLGNCNFKDNLKLFFDFAELYNVPVLKTYLKENIELSIENFFQYFEMANSYEFIDLRFKIFVQLKISAILHHESFMKASKDFILFLVKLEHLEIPEEDLFCEILLWSSKQCKNCDTTKMLYQRMREEFIEIFEHIRFAIMDIKFLHQIFSSFHYFFSATDRKNILEDNYILSQRNKLPFKVSLHRDHRMIQIIDKNGKYLFNKPICHSQKLWKQISEFKDIPSQKLEDEKICWKFPKKLENNYKIDGCYLVGFNAYHLVITEKGILCLKNNLNIETKDFVVTTFAKNKDFVVDEGCTLRVF